jgi:hypothetical protein
MIMAKFSSAILILAVELLAANALHAQNPPMNCTPDGIIEVCVLADSVAAPSVAAPVTPPAPKVTFKNGLLAISAENVSLSDVLREVSAKTGAAIDVPSVGAGEPVFANVGPGPVREVLAALLNGSRFNYVIAGSPNSTLALKSVTLTPTHGSSDVAQPSSDGAENTQPAFRAGIPSRKPDPASAQDQTEEQRANAAEVERAREEAMAMMARDREEQSKQGAASAAPPADPQN